MNYLPGVGQTGVLSYDSCRQVVWSSVKVSELTRIELVSLPTRERKTYINNISPVCRGQQQCGQVWQIPMRRRADEVALLSQRAEEFKDSLKYEVMSKRDVHAC